MLLHISLKNNNKAGLFTPLQYLSEFFHRKSGSEGAIKYLCIYRGIYVYFRNSPHMKIIPFNGLSVNIISIAYWKI